RLYSFARRERGARVTCRRRWRRLQRRGVRACRRSRTEVHEGRPCSLLRFLCRRLIRLRAYREMSGLGWQAKHGLMSSRSSASWESSGSTSPTPAPPSAVTDLRRCCWLSEVSFFALWLLSRKYRQSRQPARFPPRQTYDSSLISSPYLRAFLRV